MNEIEKQAFEAAEELVSVSTLEQGDLLVIGCSSSEIAGGMIGKASSLECAQAVFNGLYPLLKEKGIYLAAQCCEHLNRAIIVEKEYAKLHHLPIVNVVPMPKAGGSFATICYNSFKHPVAVEGVKADAGLDIGDTLIGMHLKSVAVPVRLKIKSIGQANVVAARVRPKFIGGERAHYNQDLL